MNVSFTENAWKNFLFWLKMDKEIFKRIKDIKRNPYEEIGKPESLKYDLPGKWSRWITNEHRIGKRTGDYSKD